MSVSSAKMKFCVWLGNNPPLFGRFEVFAACSNMKECAQFVIKEISPDEHITYRPRLFDECARKRLGRNGCPDMVFDGQNEFVV